MPSTFTLAARWVFPVAGLPVPDGIVTVRGEVIEAVSPRGGRTADVNCGNAAIIPGLVNAHTHLDLSGARGLVPPTDPHHFTDWLRGVIAYRRSRSSEQVRADISAGLAESLRYGTTLIGDIAANGDSWDTLATAPMLAVVFRELIGLSAARAEAADKAWREWVSSHPATATCRPGFSPHSPYSVRESILLEGNPEWTTAIHLAESPGELELIRWRSGPFVSFLQELGAWDEGGPVRDIDRVLIRNRNARNVLFVHCNYLPPDISRYFHGGMSIVYCPRTHAAFGCPPHPFRDLLSRGVRVCLGTDSLASNPDLDVLAEARFVHGLYPDFPGDRLLRMVTLAGAEALGWSDLCGSLEPGKLADLAVAPLPDRDDEPHKLLFAHHAGDRRTMFHGRFVETQCGAIT